MAEADWQLVPGSVEHGATFAAGATFGLGSGATYAARAITAGPHVHARRVADPAFAPATSGAAISAVLRRGRAGSEPFVFVGLQADNVSARGYLLGLDDAGHVVLVKGRLVDGVPVSAAGVDGVLARGSVAHPLGASVHVRLEATVNATPDGGAIVLLSPTSSGAAVPGLPEFIDDRVGVASGSLPLVGGFVGWGARLSAAGAYAQLGAFTALRQ